MDSCIAMRRPPPSLGLSFRIRVNKGPSEGLRLCFLSLVSWNRAMCISFWARNAAISRAFPDIPLHLNWRILRMPFDCLVWELIAERAVGKDCLWEPLLGKRWWMGLWFRGR